MLTARRVEPGSVVGELRRQGIGAGDALALVIAPEGNVGLATASESMAVVGDDPVGVVAEVEHLVAPRWVEWSQATAAQLVGSGLRLARAWDVAAVHRQMFGGWRADPARVWARLEGLSTDDMPAAGPVDLFSQIGDLGDPEDPVRSDGHLRADWIVGGWADTPERCARWAAVLAAVGARQKDAVAALHDRPMALPTARSESAAELLCAELAADGLPMDRDAAEALVARFVGPRPRSERDAAEQREQRDAEVLRHATNPAGWDLRSPGQVKSLLRSVGVEVPDTRAWRLEAVRDAHPLVDALLTWRKAERVATTFGYAWLDAHLGADGRFRGEWSGADGAAGRMTASAGLHNMPADLRGGVVAEPGHRFVRADLGQIEPRVLAAVSGDAALAHATLDDDLYLPVAAALDVDRPTAKVAVLGAMYGQTTGHGAQALRRLQSAYPVAMAYLDAADRSAQVGNDLRTYGGRLVRMGSAGIGDLSDREARTKAAARGRYGRNAMVQGAAAELFKVWAVTVRARSQELDATIVLCLHDELLVHVREDDAEKVALVVDDCLQEAAARWAPDRSVRFLADTSVITSWADAKG